MYSQAYQVVYLVKYHGVLESWDGDTEGAISIYEENLEQNVILRKELKKQNDQSIREVAEVE